MAIGNSNKIVIEIDPNIKAAAYVALRAKGITMKDWFTDQVISDLLNSKSFSSCIKDQKTQFLINISGRSRGQSQKG